jgi:hypothetical protein
MLGKREEWPRRVLVNCAKCFCYSAKCFCYSTECFSDSAECFCSSVCSCRVESNRDETSRLCGAVGRLDVLRGGSIILLLAVGEEWWHFKPRPLLDLNDSTINRDRYCMRRINHDVQVHPPTSARLYKSPSYFCSGCQFKGIPVQETSPSLPLFAAFFSHSHRLHRAHSTGESRASGTSSCYWRSCSG